MNLLSADYSWMTERLMVLKDRYEKMFLPYMRQNKKAKEIINELGKNEIVPTTNYNSQSTDSSVSYISNSTDSDNSYNVALLNEFCHI